jgi:cytosine/adenosine deaminase-related metal-dependent hydrolase
MDILARGKWVITDARDGEDGILNDGAAYFSNGVVVETGDFETLRKKYPEATVKGNGKQLLMPGFVDGHSHGWGLSAIQRGLRYDFLENVLIDWAKMLNIDPETNAMMSAIRHLRSGCTTMHHNNWGEAPNLGEIAKKALQGYMNVGIRFAYSPGMRNENTLAYGDEDFFTTLPPDLQDFCRPMVYYDKEAVIEEFFSIFEDLYSRYNNDHNRIIFGPSWAQGATEEFLQRVKSRADELGKIPIHIHTLQSPHQKAYGLKKYGKSLVFRLHDLGIVDENLTLGHAVYLDEDDIALLAEKGASTTHHPSCNFAVRNGISPVYFLHNAGVNVALGIDDKGINDDEDAIMELRLIYYLHRVSGFDLADTPPLTAFDVLKMGTRNAAKVCGFDGEVGALKPGMKADAILVDLTEIMDDPWMSPELNIADIFIHRAKGVHVNTVMVGGEVIMEERKFLTVDLDSLYKEVRQQAEKGISAEQKAFAENLAKIKPYYHAYYRDWPQLDFDPYYIMNSRK